MSNTTTRPRSTSSSRSSSAPSRPSQPTPPSRSTQATQARQATTAPRPAKTTTPAVAPKTTTPAVAPKRTTPAVAPKTEKTAAETRLQQGAAPRQEKPLQTGADRYDAFVDNTREKATVPDLADRLAGGFAEPQGCPNGQCGGQPQGGDQPQGGGGGFLDKLTQLGQTALDITRTAIEAGQSKAQEGVDKAQELYNQATTRFDLNDEQRKQVTEALGTLKKLAGEDGRWNANDIGLNVNQLGLGVLGRPIAEGQLRQGIQELTGKPVEKLTPEQRQAAAEKWRSLSPEDQERLGLSRSEMKSFSSTMDMVKERAKALGLPEDKMPDGLNVRFLQGILNNDPGALLMFKR